MWLSYINKVFGKHLLQWFGSKVDFIPHSYDEKPTISLLFLSNLLLKNHITTHYQLLFHSHDFFST